MDLLAPFRMLRNVIWGVPPEDPVERKLLFKIDCLVLTYVCLIYWANYLDRTNFANAYATGMQEDLHMGGDDLNVVNTVFLVGYVVGMIPNNLALLKIRPKYWLSFCALAWGLLVLGLYKITSYEQACAIRFFQGVFEASTFSGTHLILGSWYQETELTKRSAVFTSSGLIGSIFSGFMQSSIQEHMDMKNGIAGWRWQFIIDFIITLPICLYGFTFFPDMPENTRSWFFNDEERALAVSRLKQEHRRRLDWSVVPRVFGNWPWYLFTTLWTIGGLVESYGVSTIFLLWLKDKNYPTSDRNNYPLGMYAMGVFGTFASSLYVDLTGARYHYHVAIFICAALVTSAALILSHPNNASYVFASQYLSGISYAGQSAYFAWANVVCMNDPEVRAIILASMNMMSSAFSAWWTIIFFKANEGPRWTKAGYSTIATSIATMVVALFIRYMQLRDKRTRAGDHEMSLVEDSKSSDSGSEKQGRLEPEVRDAETDKLASDNLERLGSSVQL